MDTAFLRAKEKKVIVWTNEKFRQIKKTRFDGTIQLRLIPASRFLREGGDIFMRWTNRFALLLITSDDYDTT